MSFIPILLEGRVFFWGVGREVGREWRHKGLKREKCLWKVKT